MNGTPPIVHKKLSINGTDSKNSVSIDLNQLFEESPIAFYTCDSSGYITFCNRSAIDLWGRTPIIGKDMWCGSWKIYNSQGEAMSIENCPMAKTIREGVSYDNELIIMERPDRSFRTVMVFPRPILGTNGKVAGAHNTLVDITDQKKSEIKDAMLSAIVESSDDAIISKDLTGNITSWNLGAERIFKYTEKEILGKPISVLIPESRLQDENMILERIRKGERIEHFETVRKDKFGNEIPLSLTVSPVKDSSGHVIGASKVARDISDRLGVEEKQAILSAIVESSDDAIISKNLNGIIMSWNAGAKQIFGYSEEEIIGKSITTLIPKKRLKEEDLIIKNIKNGKKIAHFETIRMDKWGRKIPISLTVSPLKNGSGKIIGASKIARDISDQVKAQKEIEKYTRNLEILNSIGKSISKKLDVKVILQKVTDATTTLTGAQFGAFFYNQVDENGESANVSTISGVTREAFEKLAMPCDMKVFNELFSGLNVLRLDDINKDEAYVRPEKYPLIKSYMAVPVTSTSGKVIGGLFFGHPDAGKFKKEHEDLVTNIAAQSAISLENSKLFEEVKNLSEKKDEFIALASHELKTPLTTIKGYLQILSKNEKDEVSEMFINKALYQVDKLDSLVKDLLQMSKAEKGKLEFNIEKFDLRQLLLEIKTTMEYSQKRHKIVTDLGEEPVYIEADKQRIEQAINNLLGNAIKYSPKAFEVFLSLDNRSEEVIISIRDKGIGMKEHEQKHLFSRFYRAESNKGISGLGLGLYLSKQIIDRHNGKIMVKSKYAAGSEFSIFLPKKIKLKN
ncbi:MAG TPA: PAS domain S-box protein [Salinimicrobium sp.]|nr:PAS domain S-box protein [Salinimicrobium sp.]